MRQSAYSSGVEVNNAQRKQVVQQVTTDGGKTTVTNNKPQKALPGQSTQGQIE